MTGPAFPTLQEVIDRHYENALLRSGGDPKAAAALLAVSYKTVYNWLNRANQTERWELRFNGTKTYHARRLHDKGERDD